MKLPQRPTPALNPAAPANHISGKDLPVHFQVFIDRNIVSQQTTNPNMFVQTGNTEST
jgi:hypothetical protein